MLIENISVGYVDKKFFSKKVNMNNVSMATVNRYTTVNVRVLFAIVS